eukprot:3050984-Prymnesium_polylepis.1
MRKALRLMMTTLSSCYPIAASYMPPLMAQRSLRRTTVEEIQLTGTDASTQTAPAAMNYEAARRGALPPH